ncbi:AsnC family transcriptional regulator [Deinococcus malanensis]|uniref:AsnC family transcriptional regulator n=1 Tax=Deinococcus malanensis TaxID=1706855 RepID=A0ABQ2F183_9DEIO|nr:Lrp/AsnC family transcriptional regulator [Deinococcus malanensis]GGK40738.1 AsnC family transcriptional regulator [Deinococcus malanensis]
MIQLDEADRTILVLLQQDDRQTYVQIGAQVGLSPATVHDRVRKLERRGALMGYQARVSPRAVGLPVTAFISLNLDGGQSCRSVTPTLEAFPEIEECHSVAGDTDLLLKVRVPSTEALEELNYRLKCLEGVVRTQSLIILSTRFEDRPRIPAPLGREEHV